MSTLWILAGILPIWISLSWNYVRIGSRLLYPAAFGIALMWGGWMAWLFNRQYPAWQRAIGGVVAILVIGVSVYQWTVFQQLYRIGVQHLDRTVDVLAAEPDKQFLFVNYPDRIELLPQPYPLGSWELTLAPVIQNLADFARATVGHSAGDRSLSAFQVGADQRAAWPYDVFMRGEDSDASHLFDAAAQVDRVYLTDYLPDGSLELREAGSIRLNAPFSTLIASFGDVALIGSAQLSAGEDVSLRIIWQCIKPAKDGDTILVHLWKDNAFVGAYDADMLGGLIPLSVCKDHTQIDDVRHIPLNDLAPGHYEVRVGLYNRFDGSRYPAVNASGARAQEDEVPIGTFNVK